MSRPQWITDSAGKITGYKTTAGGADTVFPFNDELTVTGRVTPSSAGTLQEYISNFGNVKGITVTQMSFSGNSGGQWSLLKNGNVVNNVQLNTKYDANCLRIICKNGAVAGFNCVYTVILSL